MLGCYTYVKSLDSHNMYNDICSGCPEAVKLLVGNKCDLEAEVDLSHARVSVVQSVELSPGNIILLHG